MKLRDIMNENSYMRDPRKKAIITAIDAIADSNHPLATNLAKIIPSNYDFYADRPESLWNKVEKFIKKYGDEYLKYQK